MLMNSRGYKADETGSATLKKRDKLVEQKRQRGSPQNL